MQALRSERAEMLRVQAATEERCAALLKHWETAQEQQAAAREAVLGGCWGGWVAHRVVVSRGCLKDVQLIACLRAWLPVLACNHAR